jgi:outer membrane lipoprotein SlyB
MWDQKLKFVMLGISVAAVTACGTANQTASGPVAPTTTTASSATGYGVVQAIDIVPREQAGIGLGTVAGAVVGGALGSQVGSGRGRTAATVAGAAGGALAGSAMERNARAGEVYRVAIQMDNGSVQTMVQETPPGLQVGERVRLSNGVIVERFQ